MVTAASFLATADWYDASARLQAPLDERGERGEMHLRAVGELHRFDERARALLEVPHLGADHREVLPRLPARRDLFHGFLERHVGGGELTSANVKRGDVVPSLPVFWVNLGASNKRRQRVVLPTFALHSAIAAVKPRAREEWIQRQRSRPVHVCLREIIPLRTQSR